jgi:hypothetical protein
MPCDALPSSLVTYLAGALTAIMAAIVTHVFALRRESNNRKEAAKIARVARKRDFLHSMGIWRTRVNRCQKASTLSANFPDEVARFGGEYIAIEQDLYGDERAEFHRLCDEIVAMKDSEIEERAANGELTGRAKLLTLIETIISILQRN